MRCSTERERGSIRRRVICSLSSNPEAASILGIRTSLVMFVSFELAGLFAAVMAMLE
jgi:ribose/xylose/arabinose/galactoside ABC-type transport system permease subunit